MGPPYVWPPTGITLREVSPYLLASYPEFQTSPPEPSGPAATAASGPEWRGESVRVETIENLTAIQSTVGAMVQYTPVPVPPGYDPALDPLAPYINLAAAMLSSLTCRDFGNGTGKPITDAEAPLAIFAMALYVEQITYRMDASRRQSAISSSTGGLQSFSAGPYSESYFGPGDANEYAWNVLDADPLLNSALMALITPECLEARKALAGDGFPPGYATQEIDWATSVSPACGGMWWAGSHYYNR